jgi:hypothetical protein
LGSTLTVAGGGISDDGFERMGHAFAPVIRRSEGSLLLSLTAVGVHSAAMLAVTGVVSVIVYEWVGVNFLRRAWINFDAVWSIVLVGDGTALLAGVSLISQTGGAALCFECRTPCAFTEARTA